MCPSDHRHAAYTLVEVMVAAALGGLVVLASIAFAIYSARSFSALSNYSEMDEQGQVALDKFTQAVRQVHGLTSYTTDGGIIDGLTFLDYDNQALSFSYDAGARAVYRIKGGVTNVLLSGCDSVVFTLYQRTPQAFTFDAVSTAVATNCKLVEVSWNCSRNLLAGDKANTQIMQSAKVAIRSN